MEANPLIYDSFKLKNNNEAKHLGDYINEGGNDVVSNCVHLPFGPAFYIHIYIQKYL